jgi:phosphate transporter
MGLPVSGFPNMSAIAQEDSLGNRYLDASDFLKNGIPATILATLVIVGPGYFIMRLLGCVGRTPCARLLRFTDLLSTPVDSL